MQDFGDDLLRVFGFCFIGAVVDGERGSPAEPDIGLALVSFREPEFTGLCVHVMDSCFSNPERGVATGLGFDFGDGVVVRIDPHSAR